MKTIRCSLAGTSLLAVLVAVAGCSKRTTSNEENERLRRDQATRSDPGAPAANPAPPKPVTDEGTPKDTESTQGAVSEHRSAVDAITSTRCDREQRCNHIGSGKKYESRSACMTKVRSDWQADLNALECPKGVAQAKLDDCLDAIRTEGCANPIEALNSLVSCRQAEICRASLSLAR